MAKRILEGKVVSAKMDKTRVLEVEERHMHKQYKKTVRRTKRFKFHDEGNQSATGDVVQVIGCPGGRRNSTNPPLPDDEPMRIRVSCRMLWPVF